MYGYFITFLFYLFIILCEKPANSKYFFLNSAPGETFNQNIPSTYEIEKFLEIKSTLNVSVNKNLRVGVSLMFSLLNGDPKIIEKSLKSALECIKEVRMPILVVFGASQWWDYHPNLWNWFNESMKGYDPKNVENVEWSSWDSKDAIAISWRNWGSQIRVRPGQNILSPKVLEVSLPLFTHFSKIVSDWVISLTDDEKYLFGGVVCGWEECIGVNSYYYPNGNKIFFDHPDDPKYDPTYSFDWSKPPNGGLQQIGYAALSSGGIKKSGKITAIDLANATSKYLELIVDAVKKGGIQSKFIMTHAGGNGANSNWKDWFPFWDAFVSDSDVTPGWSFYFKNPCESGDVVEELKKAKRVDWAASEWWWPGSNKEEWFNNMKTSLTCMGNCRLVDAFNWETFKKDENALEALRDLVKSF